MSHSHNVAEAAGEDLPGLPESMGASDGGSPGFAPLAVSALMVTKADLIAALRVYVPQLSDIEAIDGERFLLSLDAQPDDAGRMV